MVITILRRLTFFPYENLYKYGYKYHIIQEYFKELVSYKRNIKKIRKSLSMKLLCMFWAV